MRQGQSIGIKLLSPNNLAIGMLAFSILMTLFQPDFYQQLILEPNAMFLNWKMYSYMIAMVAFFYLGGFIFKKFSRNEKSIKPIKNDSTFNILVMISFIVWILIILNLIVLVSIINTVGFGQFVNSTLHPSNDARIMTSQVKAGNGLSWLNAASNGAMSVLIWFVLGRMNTKSQPIIRRIYSFSLLCGFFAITLIASLSTQARGPVLSTILQATFGVIAAYALRGKLNTRKLFNFSLILLVVSVLFFGLVQQSRIAMGGNQVSYSLAIAKSFIGYFPASYNRLAYILDHRLSLPGAGSGYLALQGIYTLPGISNLFKIADIARGFGLNVPQDEFTAWQDSFSYIRYGGLNEAFIWPTVWGGALLDFGPFAPLWWTAYGILGAWAFREFQRFSFSGLLIYPWFAVSILQWYGDAVIGNRTLAILIIISFIMSFLMYLIRNAPQRTVYRRT